MGKKYVMFCIAYDCAKVFEQRGLCCDEAYVLTKGLYRKYKQYVKGMPECDCYDTLQDFLKENLENYLERRDEIYGKKC